MGTLITDAGLDAAAKRLCESEGFLVDDIKGHPQWDNQWQCYREQAKQITEDVLAHSAQPVDLRLDAAVLLMRAVANNAVFFSSNGYLVPMTAVELVREFVRQMDKAKREPNGK